MIGEEEIIQEAKKYYSNNIQCYDAFLHGVEFVEEHLKNIWHTNEEPEVDEDIIALDRNGASVSGIYTEDFNGKSIHYCTLCSFQLIDKWAYVKDLLPKS